MRNKGFGGIVMATAVICEFNPFHNGHKYLLESAKNVLKRAGHSNYERQLYPAW